jgi:hypothetical protein
MHPSLPSYSRINHQINETSVVWQEKIGGYNRIFYSRLNMINDTLRNYLAPVIIDTMNSQGFMDIDTLNMIARIGGLGSYFPTHDLIPTIYRGVETKVNTYDPVIQQFKYRFFDRIYWSGYNFNGYGITQYRIDLTNNLFYPTTPLFLGSDYPMFIWSPNYILSQPSVSQGSFYYNNNYSSLYYNNSDSAVVINFVAFPEGSNPTTTNSRIWQVNLPYSNIYDYWSQDYYDLDSKVYSRLTSYKGTYPQLSAKQYIQNNHNNLYQNRRIFETGNSIYHLVSTQEYFHRDFDNEDYSYNFFGYHHDNKKLMVTPIWFSKSDGKLFTIGLKSSYYDSTCECNRHLDTITSNWISLKDITDAGFLEYGKGIGNFLIKLERMSDGRRFNIKLSEKSDSIFIHHKLKLLNANENEKYRIIWSKGHQNATYAEEMVLGGLPVVEDMNDSLNNPMTERSIIQENYEIIDLGGESINLDSDKMLISIYPNPAGNNVFVKAQLPSSVYLEFGNSISNHKIKYQVYSQIGCIQMTVEGTPGETVSINTSSLPAGVYFIRAEHKSDNYYEPVSPVVEPFVISR